MRSRLGALVPLLGLVTLVVVGPGCAKKPEIAIELTIPSDAVEDTVWLEIGAYRDASCGAVSPMLLNGVPEGASARVAFKRDKPAPRFGDLDRGTYAFGAVARAEDCGVLATGCAEFNVDKVDKVSITMRGTDAPTGACLKGETCAAARCVPAIDNKNPAVGSECSLELLGAGPLALSLGADTLVSAPAVASTPTGGFVIAYREVDGNGSNPRITVVPVDAAGGALSAGTRQLKNRCAGSDEFDGVGLIMNGADGQIVLSRSACGARPAMELLTFTAKPNVTINPAFIATDSATAQRLTVANAHVVARGAGGNLVVYNEDGVGRVAPIKATGVDPKLAGSFGGIAGITGTWAASSDKVLALLAAGPGGEPLPPDDGGVEGGSGSPGGETGDPQLSLIMVPPTTTLDQFNVAENKPRPPITFPGVWGAVAALGTRVIVVSDGGVPGSSTQYRAFDLDRTATADSNGIKVEGPGTVTTADVAMIDDKLYVAAIKPADVSLHVFANASTTPRPLRDVIFAKQPRIPSVALVRDTARVAIGVTSKRVLVAWTTASKLTNNDPTGGYAVFACTP